MGLLPSASPAPCHSHHQKLVVHELPISPDLLERCVHTPALLTFPKDVYRPWLRLGTARLRTGQVPAQIKHIYSHLQSHPCGWSMAGSGRAAGFCRGFFQLPGPAQGQHLSQIGRVEACAALHP